MYKICKLSLLFFFCCAVPLLSMEEDNNKAISAYEKYLKFDNETFKNITEEVYRSDPLFFKLNINGRDIYILGSQHDVSPQLLLPKKLLEFLNELRSKHKAKLFIEHSSIYDHFFSFFNSIDIHTKKDEWVFNEEYFNNIEELKNQWKEIENHSMQEPIKIKDIFKLDFLSGTNLFYGFSTTERKKILGGFETTLLVWEWQESIGYLETNEQLIEIGKKYEEENKEAFLEALSTYYALYNMKKNIYSMNKKNYNEEMTNITVHVLDAIENYNYESHFDFKDVSNSTIERNRIWVKTIKKTLSQNKIDNSPLLIVCGLEHLKGIFKKKSQSFLALLIKKFNPKKIDRMLLNGTWESIEKI